MSRTSLSREQILSILTTTPSLIAELTDGLADIKLCTPFSPEEWSAHDVLAHLRSCADVWGNSILTIINQDRPTIPAINPRTWIKSTDYPDQEFRASLQAFTLQRAELLAVLEPLKPKSWPRSAIVTGAGNPLELTVHSYAERLAVHERQHVKQIKQIAQMMHD